MKRAFPVVVSVVTAMTLVLAGCGGEDEQADPNAPVTITLAGWSLATTPEFKTLADGFHAANPKVTVELKEYDAANYDTQMVADLAAHSAPDMYVQKTLKNFFTYQDGGQLMDVSDVAKKLSPARRSKRSTDVCGAASGPARSASRRPAGTRADRGSDSAHRR